MRGDKWNVTGPTSLPPNPLHALWEGYSVVRTWEDLIPPCPLVRTSKAGLVMLLHKLFNATQVPPPAFTSPSVRPHPLQGPTLHPVLCHFKWCVASFMEATA